MLLSIDSNNFFKAISDLRYVYIYDPKFNKEFLDTLLFYPGDPRFIVDVSIFTDKKELKPEDVLITYGVLHNHKDIISIINQKHQEIYELCKSVQEEGFILDLNKMHIIKGKDFTEILPTYGLNSLFTVNYNIELHNKFYCLVNTGNSKDSEVLCWFLSYIYSKESCLSPLNKYTNESKQFLYHISKLFYNKVNPDIEVTIPTAPHIVNCGLGDFGRVYLEVPGKISRLNILMEKSLAEKNRKKGKNR